MALLATLYLNNTKTITHVYHDHHENITVLPPYLPFSLTLTFTPYHSHLFNPLSLEPNSRQEL